MGVGHQQVEDVSPVEVGPLPNWLGDDVHLGVVLEGPQHGGLPSAYNACHEGGYIYQTSKRGKYVYYFKLKVPYSNLPLEW